MADIVKRHKYVPNLSDDVLTEILLKLPVRSLLSFRSVSKHWLSLIKSPNFLHLLTTRPIEDIRNNPLLILRNVNNSQVSTTTNTVVTLLSDDDNDETMDLHHVFPNHGDDVHLLGPCDGLFCITDTFDVVVFNPTTRRSRKLPRSRLSPEDGSVSNHRNPFGCVGFGFDPVCNDYKVVRFKEVSFNREDDDDSGDDEEDIDDGDYEVGEWGIRGYKVDVFSLSTKRWREIEGVVPACDTYGLDSYSLFVNGAFHWLERHSDGILVFDLIEESFEQFDMPNSTFGVGNDALTLSVLYETLAMIWQRGDVFEIWVMEEYGCGESWIEIYSFNLVMEIDKSLSFGHDEEFLLETEDGELVSFNLSTKMIKDFQVHGVSGEMYAFRYRESLVSLE